MTEAREMAEFLLDRIDEDEAVAKGARWRTDQHDPLERLEFPDGWLSAERIEEAGLDPAVAAQIMRWSPSRTEFEVQAKRDIVNRFALTAANYEAPTPERAIADDLLRIMAHVYCTHPDWRMEWAPRG